MSRICETIETAVDVIERLQNAGHVAVFAGGCVRDFILEVEPNDIDIATSASPEQVEALFEKTVAVGKSFGVIRVIFDDEEFEVATFRKDSPNGDGRRPDSVEFSSMEEDAKRRDLTINALFFDPINDKIHDFVGGQADIKARNIRFVGNPDERIQEDKLRMLRVIRFASRGGWVLNQATANAVVRNAQNVKVVSAERIADELSKIFCQPKGYIGYEKLKDFCLWEHVLGGVAYDQGIRDALRHVQNDIIGNKVAAWSIVLSGCKNAREVLNGLRFDGDTVSRVCRVIENQAMFDNAKILKGSERMKLIAEKDFDISLILLRALNGGLRTAIANYLVDVKNSTPAGQIHPEKFVDGNDLIAMGVKPGKQIAKILQIIADEQREGRITNRDTAMEKARNLVAELSA
jgi:tRNA nucleotidyltransferase/poly(A) polymerase